MISLVRNPRCCRCLQSDEHPQPKELSFQTLRTRKEDAGMTALFLIRHAEAYTNVEELADGVRGDTRGLTPLGVRQAEQLRDRLRATGEIAADVLVTSSLLRAWQTAAILTSVWGLTPLPMDDLHEMRPGVADGMREEEARARYGSVDPLRTPTHPIYPGGESKAQFISRVGTALAHLVSMYHGTMVVAVCHAGVIDASFQYFFGLPADAPRPVDFRTHHTGITHWEEYRRFSGEDRWRLCAYNDALHLRDLEGAVRIPWEALAPKPVVGADIPPLRQVET